MPNNTLINTFIKKQHDLLDQNNTKTPVKIKQKIPVYKLTSDKKFEELKQSLLQSILNDTTVNVIDYSKILSKFTSESITSSDPQYCSLAVNVISTNPKVRQFLTKIDPSAKFINTYETKL